jgi:hypothetical protein
LRYLSTELCGPAEELAVPEREHPANAGDEEKLSRFSLEVVR